MAENAESPEEKAVRLLTRQLTELQVILGLNYKDPAFIAWRDTTMRVLEMFLGPDSPHLARFRGLRFFGPAVMVTDFGGSTRLFDQITPEDRAAFQKSCTISDASLKAAIKDVEDFGIYVGQHAMSAPPSRRTRGKSGGVNFHAPVTVENLAIAADNAIQKIGQVGGTTGANLKEIANLLQQSEDLTPRQLKQGIADIKALAVEVEKPETTRNWKSILDYGQTVLAIADKAADLGHKLAQYTPAIATLVDRAKHLLA